MIVVSKSALIKRQFAFEINEISGTGFIQRKTIFLKKGEKVRYVLLLVTRSEWAATMICSICLRERNAAAMNDTADRWRHAARFGR